MVTSPMALMKTWINYFRNSTFYLYKEVIKKNDKESSNNIIKYLTKSIFLPNLVHTWINVFQNSTHLIVRQITCKKELKRVCN